MGLMVVPVTALAEIAPDTRLGEEMTGAVTIGDEMTGAVITGVDTTGATAKVGEMVLATGETAIGWTVIALTVGATLMAGWTAIEETIGAVTAGLLMMGELIEGDRTVVAPETAGATAIVAAESVGAAPVATGATAVRPATADTGLALNSAGFIEATATGATLGCPT